MKTIKVIDLLNMIFNKELPDGSKVRIKCAYGYYEGTYTYKKNYYWKCSLIDFDIEDKGKNENMFFLAYNYDLNDEVEIIEGVEKEIEKIEVTKDGDCKRYIEYYDETGHHKYVIRVLDEYFAKKINELTDAVNELRKENK